MECLNSTEKKENTPAGTLNIERENKTCPKGEECAKGNSRVYVASPQNQHDWCYLSLFPDESAHLARSIKRLVGDKRGELYFRTGSGQKDIYIPNLYVPEEGKLALKRGQTEDLKRTSYEEKPINGLWGLLFLQGTPRDVIQFLKFFYPNFYVMKDCALRNKPLVEDRVAVIPNDKMQILQKAMAADYTRVMFLKTSYDLMVKGKEKREMISGALKGQLGYIVRIRANRHFVFRLTDDLVACVGGVHNDLSRVIEQVAT